MHQRTVGVLLTVALAVGMVQGSQFVTPRLASAQVRRSVPVRVPQHGQRDVVCWLSRNIRNPSDTVSRIRPVRNRRIAGRSVSCHGPAPCDTNRPRRRDDARRRRWDWPARQPPCAPRPVQLRHACSLPGEAYVARQRLARRQASPRVPAIRAAGAGCVRHGTVSPDARPRGCASRATTARRRTRPSACCPIASPVTSLATLDATRARGRAPSGTARSVEAAADVAAPRHHAALGRALDPTAPDAGPASPCSPSSPCCPTCFTGDASPLRRDASRLATAAALGHAAPAAQRPHLAGAARRRSDSAPGRRRRDAPAPRRPHGMGADRAGPSRRRIRLDRAIAARRIDADAIPRPTPTPSRSFRYGLIADLRQLRPGDRSLHARLRREGRRASTTSRAPRAGASPPRRCASGSTPIAARGFDALKPRPRAIVGQARALPQAVADQRLRALKEAAPDLQRRDADRDRPPAASSIPADRRRSRPPRCIAC